MFFCWVDPQIAGSVDLLGNPIGLVSSLGSGVYDLFYEPARGLVKSPKARWKSQRQGRGGGREGWEVGLGSNSIAWSFANPVHVSAHWCRPNKPPPVPV